MARRMAFWGAALLLALPQYAWGLGLGSIELRSALNQPLDAEIPLTSATDEDLASLRVEVAALEVFQRQGLDRPAFLNSLQFAVIRRPDGTPALRVTSTQAAREPFLTFLVEARWARGRVLREYTVLLDPPTFTETPAREAPVAAPRTPAVQPDERTRRVAQPSPTTQPGPAARLPSPRLADDGTYLVQRNDTLSGLAGELRPAADISLNQMMIALFEANPEAFDGNINRLRAGARLAVPSAETLRRLAPAEATARVAAQNRAWRDAPAAEPAPRLRLVAPGEATPSGEGPAAAEARAEAAALRDESSRLREETARLRDELDETRRLLELRDAELAELQQQLAGERDRPETPAVAPVPAVPGTEDRIFVDDAPTPVEAPAPAAEPAPTVAEPARPAPPPAPAPAPGLMAQVMGWLAAPLLWIGLGVVALLGALAVFLRRRRERAEDENPWAAAEAEDLADEQRPVDAPADREDDAERTQRMAAVGGTGAAALATGAHAAQSARQAAPAQAEPGVHAQEVADGDPLAEADFHMAYGLYDQAADLVQQALADTPERSDLHLKLVEIYFVWGHQEGFVEAARALKAQVGDGAEWDKTLIMARQICPEDPLFAGETASGDLELDFEGGEDTGIYALDFEVDDAESAPGADPRQDAASLDMQFDDDPEAAEAAAEEEFMLGIGSRTATNIERGLLEDELSDAESPTIETPTIESPELSDMAETQESLRPELAETQESPTLEQPRMSAPGGGVEGLEADATREIDLDDLGLDLEGLDVDLSDEDLEVTGLGEAVIDLGDADQADATAVAPAPAREQPQVDEDAEDAEDLLSATGITQVLDERRLADDFEDDTTLGDDDATRLAPSLTEDEQTRLATALWDDEATRLADTLDEEQAIDRGAATARIDVGELPAADASGEHAPGEHAAEDVDERGDTALFPAITESDGDSTVEQPRPGASGDDAERFAADVFGAEGGSDELSADDDAFDFEVGELFDGGTDEDLTGEVDPSAEPETLTELGTKLDLARAYIDMGDPEGARSILEEVIEEGDGAHRQEARQLLETLGD